ESCQSKDHPTPQSSEQILRSMGHSCRNTSTQIKYVIETNGMLTSGVKSSDRSACISLRNASFSSLEMGSADDAYHNRPKILFPMYVLSLHRCRAGRTVFKPASFTNEVKRRYHFVR